jgi:ABC-type transporter Mla maintaining outer membrane lipid asymmetry ATPase subunit MlaF
MVNFRQQLEQKRGQQKQVNLNHHTACQSLYVLQEQQGNFEKAQVVIQVVALLTQNQLRYHISEIVTLALASVFDDPYEFDVEFVQRRGQTECDLSFVREDAHVSPLTASGGGVVDIAAFALRVALWSLKQPHTRPILILDEPFRFVSANYKPKASEMLKMISERLGLQIIMVTHSEELIECADAVFVVTQKRGISKITKEN